MCGIAGFVGKQENKEEILDKMMNAIIHRGPDSEGKYTTDEVALGFRRLSIIDLESGSQPMFNEDGEIALIFNGEIYNSPQLRERFKEKGHVFANRSDSETLIHGYEEYGEKLVHELRGMFGFAIWDNRKKRLFMARDYFGIKPVYYALIDGNLVFGSEIKSILEFPGFKKEVNVEALEQYLSFQYSAMPETFFKGVYRLLPGHYLTYHKGELNLTQYFDPTLEPVSTDNQETLVKKLDEVLQDSVEKHMLADVEGPFCQAVWIPVILQLAIPVKRHLLWDFLKKKINTMRLITQKSVQSIWGWRTTVIRLQKKSTGVRCRVSCIIWMNRWQIRQQSLYILWQERLRSM